MSYFTEYALLNCAKDEEMIPLNSCRSDQEQGLPNLAFPNSKELMSSLQVGAVDS